MEEKGLLPKVNNMNQKTEERFFIEKSLEIAGIEAPIKEQGNPPAPDAIILYEGAEIGLEHTELFKSRNIQNLQKFANDVTQAAYKNYNGPAFSIYPTFETGITKIPTHKIGEDLAAFVSEASEGIHWNPSRNNTRLPQIKKVRVARYPCELNLKQSAWRPEIDFPKENMLEELKRTINEKECKRKNDYSTQQSRNWLLITMQQMQDSQFFHWQPGCFDSAIVTTGFERIILCDLSFSRWHDIPPK